MSEIGLAEIFSMAEAATLVATLFVILYFSKKQAQSLSVDIETKVPIFRRKKTSDYSDGI